MTIGQKHNNISTPNSTQTSTVLNCPPQSHHQPKKSPLPMHNVACYSCSCPPNSSQTLFKNSAGQVLSRPGGENRTSSLSVPKLSFTSAIIGVGPRFTSRLFYIHRGPGGRPRMDRNCLVIISLHFSR